MNNKMTTDWSVPQEVDPITLAFPANVVGTLLPNMTEIPEEFRNHYGRWQSVVSQLFFKGGSLPKVKEGIDATRARNHLMSVLRSFEPCHEHKIAGAAWFMSMWFELPDA